MPDKINLAKQKVHTLPELGKVFQFPSSAKLSQYKEETSCLQNFSREEELLVPQLKCCKGKEHLSKKRKRKHYMDTIGSNTKDEL